VRLPKRISKMNAKVKNCTGKLDQSDALHKGRPTGRDVPVTQEAAPLYSRSIIAGNDLASSCPEIVAALLFGFFDLVEHLAYRQAKSTSTQPLSNEYLVVMTKISNKARGLGTGLLIFLNESAIFYPIPPRRRRAVK
jgi:hypothetical protein